MIPRARMCSYFLRLVLIPNMFPFYFRTFVVVILIVFIISDTQLFFT